MSEQLKKDYRIEICLFTDYVTLTKKCWMHIEKYMSFKFLNKVKALKNLIQHKYN